MRAESDEATVICSQPGVRLQLHNIEDIVISGTTFIACKEIEVSFVDQFRFKNSSFQSSPNGSLTVNHTMNATILGSSFLEMMQGQCNKAAMTINNSSVLVQYCTFSNSEAGIYSTHSAITIDSCTFVNNSLMGCDYHYRPAVVTTLNGLQTSKIVTVTNCDAIDNHKNKWTPFGALFFINGSTLILNNSFVNNTEFNELLYIKTEHSQIFVAHNTISDNEISSAAAYIDANNISTTISHNNFKNNTATALLLHVSDSMVKISDGHFSGNRPFWYQSGAIDVGPEANAIIKGDGCSLNVSILITRCIFVHNHYLPFYDYKGAVGICFNTGSVSIVQSTFINNFASSTPGAAVSISTNSSVVIDSCDFIENKGPKGGAVYIKRASSVLINCTNFLNDQGSMDKGGALTLDYVENSVIVINESYFFGNLNNVLNWTDKRILYSWAATIYLYGTYNSLIIDKSSIINSVVYGNPFSGILLASGTSISWIGNVTISRSNFTNNMIEAQPFEHDAHGGLSLSANTVKIVETIFRNNTAGVCGALRVEVNDIYIISTLFVRNSAMHYNGGAICSTGLNRMVISNCTFSHNYAKTFGGVLANLDSDTLTLNISGSIFDNNRADLQGGVFWTHPLGVFNIRNSIFIKNKAGSDGGVMVMKYNSEMNSQLSIRGSYFDQNKAAARGGVFADFTPWTYLIDNSSFTGNQAGTDGGVMYVGSNSSRVRISDGSTFDFNNATDRGGVISINGSRLEISNTVIFNNNFASIGDDIIACNCDINISTVFTLQSYTDPDFPNYTLYGHYEVTTARTGYVVVMAATIPIAFIVILLLLTATLLDAYLCFRRRKCLVEQYRVRRSDDPDFVPLINNT